MLQLPQHNEVSELSNNLLFTVQRLKDVLNDISSNELAIGSLRTKDEEYKKQIDLIEISRELYKKAVEEVYSNSIGKIEIMINDALKYIFFDKMYSIELVVGDNRGKTVDFLLYDNGYSPP